MDSGLQIIKDQRRKVFILKLVITILMICIVLNIVLAFLGYALGANLISSFLMGYFAYKTLNDLQIQSSVLVLKRYLFEEGFREKYDEENDI